MLNILMLTASPAGLQKLEIAAEVSAIKTKLLGGEQGDLFRIHPIYDATVDDLSVAFRQVQPEVLHFSGHALRGELLFEGGKSGHRVPRQGFARLIELLKERLRCVVLNACTSEAQALELARTVDCVVGMREGIDDDAAIAFSTGFYEALAWGDSVGKAFELGCNRVHLERSEQYTHPMLYCRTGVDAQQVYLTTCLQTFCMAAKSERSYLDTLLKTHLAPLVRRGVLRCWEPGRALNAWDLEAETTKQLEAAQLVLVLLSADLIASPETYRLLQRALTRHASRAARVVPILVRPLDISASPLCSLAILPSSRKALSEYRQRDTGWFDVMKDLTTIIDDVVAAQIRRRNETTPHPTGPGATPPPITPPPALPAPTAPIVTDAAPVQRPHPVTMTTPPSQSTPTRASVRSILARMFPTEPEFSAFCVDRFFATYQLFGGGMTRLDKVNLLLQRQDTTELVLALQSYTSFAKFNQLLEHE